jgi:hypothetical protein
MGEPRLVGSGLDDVIRRCERALSENVWPRAERDREEAARRAEQAERLDLHEFARECIEGVHRSDAKVFAQKGWKAASQSLASMRKFKHEALKLERAQTFRDAEARKAKP